MSDAADAMVRFDVRCGDGAADVTLKIADAPLVELTAEQARNLARGLTQCLGHGARGVVLTKGHRVALTSGSRTVCLTVADRLGPDMVHRQQLPHVSAGAIAEALAKAAGGAHHPG